MQHSNSCLRLLGAHKQRGRRLFHHLIKTPVSRSLGVQRWALMSRCAELMQRLCIAGRKRLLRKMCHTWRATEQLKTTNDNSEQPRVRKHSLYANWFTKYNGSSWMSQHHSGSGQHCFLTTWMSLVQIPGRLKAFSVWNLHLPSVFE